MPQMMQIYRVKGLQHRADPPTTSEKRSKNCHNDFDEWPLSLVGFEPMIFRLQVLQSDHWSTVIPLC